MLCFVFMLLIFKLIPTLSVNDPLNIDKSGWINPHDMFAYDPGTKSISLPIKLTKCNSKSTDNQYPTSDLSKNVCDDASFRLLRRFVKKMSDKIDELLAGKQELDQSIVLKIDPSMIRSLSYAPSESCSSTIEKYDAVFDKMMNALEVVSHNSYPNLLIYTLFVSGLVIFIMFCFATLKTKILITLFLYIITAFIWEYCHQYQLEVAKLNHDLQIHYQHCFYEQKKFLHKLYDFIAYTPLFKMLSGTRKIETSSCYGYYEHFYVTPLLKVNPMFVLNGTLSRLIFHFFGAIASDIGLFFSNLYENGSIVSFVFSILIISITITYVIPKIIIKRYEVNKQIKAIQCKTTLIRTKSENNLVYLQKCK